MKIAVLALHAFDKASDTVEPFIGRSMSKLIIALFVSAGLGLAGPALAQMYGPKTADMAMSKDAYTAAKASADAQYKTDKDACWSMSGNANDVCVADAKGKESITKAEAEAAYKRTPKAREAARVAHAQANYDVAIEKCDRWSKWSSRPTNDLAGNVKDVCVKEAKAQLVKGKSDAKVDRVTTDARQDAGAKQAEARKDANEASRNAEYQVAIEKCDAQAGTAKEACVSGANLRFGKS